MTHPKDMDEHAEGRADDAELLLVDLLYGELDEGEEAEARERVRERDLGGELGGLEQLRAMLAELPEEEPPAAISAKLMHAAAMHAPGAAARKSKEAGGEDDSKGILGWLSSLIRPIAMYPGLAAATTLVLVVGVAGTLYLSGRDQFAEPRLPAPEAVSPPSGEVAMPEAVRAEAEQVMAGADEAGEGQAEAEQAPAEEPAMIALPQAGDGRASGIVDGEERARRSAPQRSTATRASKKRAVSAYEGKELDQVLGGGAPGSASGGAGTGSSYGSGYGKGAANAAPATSTAKDSLSVDDEAPAADMDAEDDGRYQQAPAEPAPRPRAEPSRADSADRPADKPAPRTKAPVSKPVAKKDSSRVRSLHDEARAAAANAQCDVVSKISGMIRKLDASYYRDTYLRDKSLAACLGKK